MRYKQIVWGVGAFFLVGSGLCLVLTAIATLAGWWFIPSQLVNQSPRLRVLLPLTAPTATPLSTPIVAEPTSALPDTLPDSATPTFTSPAPPAESPLSPDLPPSFIPVPSPTLPPTADSSAGELNLPAGSVNSLTKQGLATKLVIPKINVESSIVLAEIKNGTWEVDHLGSRLVGHLEGTAPPGSTSNMVLAAHVTTARGVYGPFAGLSLLRAGDEIIVYERDRPFRYEVIDYQVVDRAAVEVTYPSNNSEITLITCSQWSQEEGRYLERLVVKGRLMKN